MRFVAIAVVAWAGAGDIAERSRAAAARVSRLPLFVRGFVPCAAFKVSLRDAYE
jgi:hypothetical protein